MPTPGSPISTGLFLVFLDSYVGEHLNKALVGAEDEAKQLGDEYVSVEHLFLAMLKSPNREIAQIWKEYGITRERFLKALSTVRGSIQYCSLVL